MTDYNAALCNERHIQIQQRLEKGEGRMDRIEQGLAKAQVRIAVIVSVAAFLAGIAAQIAIRLVSG